MLSANQLGSALYPEVFIDPVRPANLAGFLFLGLPAPEYRSGTQRCHHRLVGDITLELRSPRAPRRHGADDARLHRRAGLAVSGCTEPPRELNLDAEIMHPLPSTMSRER
jgi:hypothetical protein